MNSDDPSDTDTVRPKNLDVRYEENLSADSGCCMLFSEVSRGDSMVENINMYLPAENVLFDSMGKSFSLLDIFQAIGDLPRLTTLSIYGRLVGGCHLPLSILSRSLQSSVNLRHLRIEETVVVLDDAEDSTDVVARTLENLTSLKKLHIYMAKFSPSTLLDKILHALSTLKTIEEMDLLAVPLERSRISGNSLGRIIRCIPKLKELNCFGFRIDNYDNQENKNDDGIAQALATNTSLEYLHLTGCTWNAGAITSLATALETNKSLKRLFLRSDYIDRCGLTAIANAMKTNNTLQHLELCDSGSNGIRISNNSSNSSNNSSNKNKTKSSTYDDDTYYETWVNVLRNNNFSLKELYVNVPHEINLKLQFYLKLNRMGRHRLLRGDSNRVDIEEWVQALISSQKDVKHMFYLFRENPTLLTQQ